MKTEIFQDAIRKRNQLRFLYGMSEVRIEPYFLVREKNGKKVLYGKIYNSSEIKKFSYNRISNIKVMDKLKFSPVIPITARVV